jgi:hypothetical protein
MERMTLLRMVGFQVALIIGAALFLAFSINFPDWHHRPPAPYKLFFWLAGSVSVLLFMVAWFTRPAKKALVTLGAFLTLVLLLVWWYIAVFLWINTYGT